MMKRPISASLVLLWRLLLAFGLLTGFIMAGLGLTMRIGDAIPEGPLAVWFGIPLFEAMGMTAGRIGWMLVLEGTFLIAAMCAIAVGNIWGRWSTAAAGLIAMIFFPGGTLAGLVVLSALGVRLIREKPWKKTEKTSARA
jgi:hypothetical protein